MIGAGPVGIYLSHRLLELGEKVTLVEAGNIRESSLLGKKNYIFNTKSALPENVHRIGGGSNLWAGRIGEFVEGDFTENAIRKESWPFEKATLLKYYRKVARKLNADFVSDQEMLDANVALRAKFLEDGLDLRFFQFIEQNAFIRLYKNMKNNSNFEFIGDHYVDVFRFVDSKANIGSYVDLECLNEEGETRILSAETVYIACGAMQSTALFLRSQRLMPNRLDNVAGKFLMEHIEGYVGILKFHKKSKGELLEQIRLNGDNRLKGASLRLGAGIRFGDESMSANSLNIHFELRIPPRKYIRFENTNGFLLLDVINFLLKLPKYLYYQTSILLDMAMRKVTAGVWIKCEELPNSNSQITLDSLEKNLIYEHKISDETWHAIKNCIYQFSQIMTGSNYGVFKAYPWIEEPDLSEFFAANWHPMGTLRMGHNPDESVCDAELKVHDIRNIFLLSSAVFPTGSNGNPTFTCLALAERCISHFKTSSRSDITF